ASVTATTAVRPWGNVAIVVIELAFCPTSGRRRRSVWRVKRCCAGSRSRPRLRLRRHEMSAYHITDGIRPQVSRGRNLLDTQGVDAGSATAAVQLAGRGPSAVSYERRRTRSVRDAQCRL